MIYRGSKVTPDSQSKSAKPFPGGIYRGVKYNTKPEPSRPSTHGIYRGTKWSKQYLIQVWY